MRATKALLLAAIVVAAFPFGAGTAQAAGTKLTTLYSFCVDLQHKVCRDGDTPLSRLLPVGSALYGTTFVGGEFAHGVVYRIGADGNRHSAHDFCADANCPDGAQPGNYLTLGPDGAIYGTAQRGGVNDGGLIYRISPGGTFSPVHRFCVGDPTCQDGARPVAVVFDKNGNMFGTTGFAGTKGGGTVFEISSGGQFSTLYQFCSQTDCGDGIQPGALTIGNDGNLYGTAQAGGAHQGGIIFTLTTGGGGFTVLYAFCAAADCADGQEPAPSLVQGSDGFFYGTTTLGGAARFGTVFKLVASGQIDTLHTFCTNEYCDDGSTPTDGLSLAPDGSLYGAASEGGHFFHGVVFRVTSTHAYAVIQDFCAEQGCFDGAGPMAAPVMAGGVLVGSTSAGGDKFNVGSVYSLEP